MTNSQTHSQKNFLITYDIRDPKRLNQVYKTLRGFGTHLQYSVFWCELDDAALQELREKLMAIIDTSVDQVLFVPTKDRQQWNTLGTPLPDVERVAWILF